MTAARETVAPGINLERFQRNVDAAPRRKSQKIDLHVSETIQSGVGDSEVLGIVE